MSVILKIVGSTLAFCMCVSAGNISTITGVTSGSKMAALNSINSIVSNPKGEVIINVWGNGYGLNGLRLFDISLSNSEMINSSAPQAWSMAIASNGDVYMGHKGQIVKYDTAGNAVVIAGLGSNNMGFSGDGGLAVAATIQVPTGIVLDKSGNIFFSDYSNQRIRKIDSYGYISTVAGNGTKVNSGDNGPAIEAGIYYPGALVLDSLGNLLVSTDNYCIRSINPTGVITTAVGTCVTYGSTGDGGQASAAYIKSAKMMRNTSRGLMFGKSDIRIVNPQGVISTLTSAGTDTTTTTGIDVQSHRFRIVTDITELPNGDILIVDGYVGEIWLLKPNNMLYLWAKGVPYLYFGDGGLAVNAGVSVPNDITVDLNGNIYFTDKNETHIRKIDSFGNISLFYESSDALYGIVNDASGNVYAVNKIGRVIYKFTPNGTRSIVAGIYGTSGDYNVGKIATTAALANPEGVVVANGLVYIADTENKKIKYVDASGIMRLYVQLSGKPTDIEYYKAEKAFYALLRDLNEVVKIDSNGIITVVAGTGVAGFSGDDGPAQLAKLNSPNGITLDSNGYLYISDSGNNRIRMVDPYGIITTISGTGNSGFTGDGGNALMADLESPLGLHYFNEGLLVCVKGRIRRIEGPFYSEIPVTIKPAVSAPRSIKGVPKVDLLGRIYK